MLKATLGAMRTRLALFKVLAHFPQQSRLLGLAHMIRHMTEFATIAPTAFARLLKFITHVLTLIDRRAILGTAYANLFGTRFALYGNGPPLVLELFNIFRSKNKVLTAIPTDNGFGTARSTGEQRLVPGLLGGGLLASQLLVGFVGLVRLQRFLIGLIKFL